MISIRLRRFYVTILIYIGDLKIGGMVRNHGLFKGFKCGVEEVHQYATLPARLKELVERIKVNPKG